MAKLKPIPQEWIRDYVDELIKFAHSCGPESPMARSAIERADHILDMVKAFREKDKKNDEHMG